MLYHKINYKAKPGTLIPRKTRIIFLIFKLILILTNQNNIKISKNKKNKKTQFFLKIFLKYKNK